MLDSVCARRGTPSLPTACVARGSDRLSPARCMHAAREGTSVPSGGGRIPSPSAYKVGGHEMGGAYVESFGDFCGLWFVWQDNVSQCQGKTPNRRKEVSINHQRHTSRGLTSPVPSCELSSSVAVAAAAITLPSTAHRWTWTRRSPRHWSVHDGKFFASAIADAQPTRR